MQKITPVLWFDMKAEEAAEFYTSLLPDSHVDRVVPAPSDNPSGKKGYPMLVEFTLMGTKYAGLNGGPYFTPNEAVSFQILTEDQAETDRLWNAILAKGGSEGPCGWIKDPWGFSWQITPRRLIELTLEGGERGERAAKAMLEMRKIDIAALEAAADAEPADA
ncbi:VOC family protein [Sphingomonas sp.]|uniref:VOC family protein n=1 Tax=Sphingomonas sp. TaxID=28214 RepID=UPI001B079767|nr:VOC family protein [Sphingomonas sp.]MBO9713343.1 VOC family protein [Sphingomonas sp.]